MCITHKLSTRPLFVAALVGLLVVVALVTASRPDSRQWQAFKSQHGKSYASQHEEAKRFVNFLAAKRHVERHNSARERASYKLELNRLSDWTREERAKLCGLRPELHTPTRAQQDDNDKRAAEFLAQIHKRGPNPIPKSHDWRQVPGRVSSVKNQGSCGSCWAFASTGALEGQEVRRKPTMVPLSEQELLDCSKTNYGCDGGLMSLAFDDIARLGGLESEANYKYNAFPRMCAFNKTLAEFTDDGHIIFDNLTETQLQEILAKWGPVAVAIQATEELIQYSHGVFNDQSCEDDQPNHAVLVVGYGKDSAHGDYWIVKNSWGADWGEKGYFRLKRGVNMCGVLSMPTIPFFDKM